MRNSKVQDRGIKTLKYEEKIKRLSELNATERRLTNQQKAIFNEHLLNAGDVANAIKLLVTCYTEYSDAVISNNIADAKNMLKTKQHTGGGVILSLYEPESEEYKEIKKRTYKKYWSEICKTNKAYFEELLKTGAINNELETEDYKQLVKHVTEYVAVDMEDRRKHKTEINHLRSKYKNVLDKIDPAFSVFMRLYLATDNDKNDYAYVTSVLARALRRAPDKLEMQALFGKKYKAPTGKKLAYAYALAEIVGNFATVRYGITDNTASKQPGNTFITYQDRATLTKDPFINELSIIKYNSNNLPALDMVLKEETITEGKEKLSVLSLLDQFVLRTIVLDFYGKQNKRTFTDKDVVIWATQTNAKKPVTEITREQVNESILKLQNVRVDLKYKSLQTINNEEINAKVGNPLVWIKERIELEGDNGVKKYEILDVPFYYTYLIVTQTPLIDFDRKLLTDDYKGIDKSLDNQQLRYYLVTRLEPKSRLNSKQIFISADDIYKIQGATPENYTTASTLRKARERVRKRTEIILNEYRKIYKFQYIADDLTTISKADETGKKVKKVKIKGRKFTGYTVTFAKY